MKAEYYNHYLTDNDVANIARQSFDKLAENFTEEQNNNLIRFLARGMASGDWDSLITQLAAGTGLSGLGREGSRAAAHERATYLRSIPEHWVPFGHPQISLRMEAPIPIRVQCFKHKIGLVESEESRRYISSKPVLFVPEYLREKAASVKQGSGDRHPRSEDWIAEYVVGCQRQIELYEDMIADDICPEQARFVLPQGCEVHWVWTGSLYAFASLYNKRSDSHAQKEIQELASQINDIIAPLFPVSWAALTKGEY